MIYLDNAATTLIKPYRVYKSVLEAMKKCANPGRGGHKPSLYAAQVVFECRREIAELFKMPDKPENIVFTHNATHALNFAIKSVLSDGGYAICSSFEHNSAVRPLEALKDRGVTYDVAQSSIFNSEQCVNSIKKLIENRRPNCVIVNHISNVFGYELPIYRIDDLCEKYDIPMIVDASQSAGNTAIDASRLKSTAYICMPGHKSLFGPQGTGVLICCKDKYLYTVLQGGTGSNSESFAQPEFLPDRFESGTLNVPGIAGLLEGVRFIKKCKIANIEARQRELTSRALYCLKNTSGIRVFSGPFHTHGVISFLPENMHCEQMCEILSENGICTRGGLHCAPLAHQSAGTLETGTVRLSLSVFNTEREVDDACLKLSQIIHKKSPVFY